ncbi:hypothetical protein VTH82DRAFT_4823 [Thermothelomyces myriococcoides]
MSTCRCRNISSKARAQNPSARAPLHTELTGHGLVRNRDSQPRLSVSTAAAPATVGGAWRGLSVREYVVMSL